MEGPCPICQKIATSKCSKCHTVFYCSKEHQKEHWKAHKSHCMPIKIKEDKKLGRHLIASKDIKDGHIVIKEKPLIVGPAQVTPPVCLGCMKTITQKDSRPCTKCGWPVCSEVCQNSPHHKPECELTAARGSKVHIKTFGMPHPNYQCLTALRCLYQKKNHPEIWKKLMALESHTKQREGTVKWQNDKLQVCEFIKRFFKLEQEFTDDEIMRVCGIIQVNGHEVPLADSPYVGIYDITSMIEHNCRANCNKSFTSHGEVLIVAAMNIAAGQNLSICYTDPLWGTVNRRHHLEETKFFQCTCERCSDVTELGTMLSALRCQHEHCLGEVLPKSFVDIGDDKLQSPIKLNGDTHNKQNGAANLNKEGDKHNGENVKENGHQDDITRKVKELNPNSEISNGKASNGVADKNHNAEDEWTTEWKCSKCSYTTSQHSVMKLMEHVGRDLDAMEKGDCDSCLRFLQHYGKYLHHNHYYMFDVSLAMANLIGQDEGGLPKVTDERLELKIDTCRKIIEVLEHLAPAEVRARGCLLFELHAALAERGKRRTSRTGEGPAVLIEHLTKSRELLTKSMHLLQHEPEELPEGKIVKQSKKNIEEMDSMLFSLHALDLPF